jgi:D-alanyl-D-alanine dipeptidase
LSLALPHSALADVPAPAALVDVGRLAPTIRVELRYAKSDNFVHRAVYPPSARCYLRRPAAQRLRAVQQTLQRQGLGLKVFDCYRPLAVQRSLWAVVPDERYVADPAKGSRHNRGAAVDLTLVDASGQELPMPTAYDAFSERAHRSFQQLPAAVLENRQRLEAAMVGQGFLPLPTEWWHFDDAQFADYPLTDISFETLAKAAQLDGQPLDPPAPRRQHATAADPPANRSALRR